MKKSELRKMIREELLSEAPAHLYSPPDMRAVSAARTKLLMDYSKAQKAMIAANVKFINATTKAGLTLYQRNDHMHSALDEIQDYVDRMRKYYRK